MKIVLMIVFCILLVGNIVADNGDQLTQAEKDVKIEGFKHAVNTCPGGIIFGVYSINYTRMLSPKNGLEIRFDYENISKKYSGDKFDITGLGFILNYRRHFSPSLESFYLGSFLRYRNYDGTGEAGEDDFDIDITEFTIGLNAGRRWVWDSGFNINFMLGYGYVWTDEKLDPDNSANNDSYDNFTDKYSFEGPMLGEFSIGYAF